MKQLDQIKVKLKDRCSYCDASGKLLKSGDILLFTNPNQTLTNLTKIFSKGSNKATTINGKFAVYVALNSREESKLIFGSGNTNIFVRTLKDKTFKKMTKNYKFPVKIDAITGDYTPMNEEWKKENLFYEAIEAYNKMKSHF